MVVRARKNNNDKFKLEEGNQEGEASVIYPILMEDEDNDGDGDRRRAAASPTKCALTSLVSATAHDAAMA